MYLSRDQPTRASPGDEPRKHKLAPKAIGPFEVLVSDECTVTILREDGFIERVTRNRTAKAPPPSERQLGLKHPANDSEDEYQTTEGAPGETAVRTAPNTDQYAEFHVVDKIVRYLPKKGRFVVRWAGYGPEDDTEEPPGHLRWNTMVQYFNGVKQRIPKHLYQYRPGAKSVQK